QMAAGGIGITLMPEMAVAAEITPASGLVARHLEGEPARQIALAWRRSSARKAEFRMLGRHFKSVLEKSGRGWDGGVDNAIGPRHPQRRSQRARAALRRNPAKSAAATMTATPTAMSAARKAARSEKRSCTAKNSAPTAATPVALAICTAVA